MAIRVASRQPLESSEEEETPWEVDTNPISSQVRGQGANEEGGSRTRFCFHGTLLMLCREWIGLERGQEGKQERQLSGGVFAVSE